ncbi:MAG TPA: protein-disulfide reductase DsbD N-terminal domain-containing protein [Noviherbaspirillum sp.]|nr:protein-disulfide reductase DsbD N-terminal domain-containing protein [Noviherbaspirillum sp.]
MNKSISIVLAAMLALAYAMPASAQQSTGKGLGGLFSSTSEDELIEPDLAFRLNVSVKDANTILAELVPAKGYYLYRERIQFSLKDANGIAISAVNLPTGEMKTDQIFGRTQVYKKPVPAEITLNRTSKANTVTLVASYQGCHEKLGVCYPPIEKAIKLTLK